MDNSTNTSGDISETVITAVGIGYILTGVIVIPLHIITSWLMWRDKEMRNPTYQFIINLSIVDVLVLISLGLYSGITLLLRKPQNYYLERFMGFLSLSFWYVNCVLFVLIAFSRWIAMTHSHLKLRIFTKKALYVMHIAPWIIINAFYLYSLFFHPYQNFFFFPKICAWGFDLSLPFGEYLHWHNFVFNTICTIIEMAFNIMSLKWVHKTRKSIQNVGTAENQRREVKLLIQCFIIGCIFALPSILFTIVYAAGIDSLADHLFAQIAWTLNHCINPFVYLSVNTKLRREFLKLVTCGKFGHFKPKVKPSAPAMTLSVGNALSVPVK